MPRRGHQVGPADYAILGLLAVAPRHGYELAGYFAHEGELAPVCELGMSQLYALLRVLQELGYVEAESSHGHGGPPRNVFRLSDAGSATFHQWLDRPVDRIRQVRTDFLLKLYFSQQLSGHDTGQLLERQLARSRAYLMELQASEMEAESNTFSGLVLSSRINAAAAAIHWLAEQRAAFAAPAHRR